jgi:hypothetical protein
MNNTMKDTMILEIEQSMANLLLWVYKEREREGFRLQKYNTQERTN